MLNDGSPTSIAVDRAACDVSVISVEGELNLTHALEIESALRTAERESSGVVVDLSRCTFMDSSGLSALIHSRRRLQRRGDRIALACRRGSVSRLLEVAVPRVFDLHGTCAEAVDGFCVDGA